jgi:hypothetical protein
MASYFEKKKIPKDIVNRLNRFYSYFYEDNDSHPEFRLFFSKLNLNLE